MPPDTHPSKSSSVLAPWAPAQVRMIEAWQGNEFMHPLTCPEHSGTALRVSAKGLRCPWPTCEYVQTAVPSIVMGDDGRR